MSFEILNDICSEIVADRVLLTLFAAWIILCLYPVLKFIWKNVFCYIEDNIGLKRHFKIIPNVKKHKYELSIPRTETNYHSAIPESELYISLYNFVLQFELDGTKFEHEVVRDAYEDFKDGDTVAVVFTVSRLSKTITIKNVYFPILY